MNINYRERNESSHYLIRCTESDQFHFRSENYWTSHPKLDGEGNSFKEAANTVLSVKEHNNYLSEKGCNSKWHFKMRVKDEMTAYELATDFVYYNCQPIHVIIYPNWINCIARQFILIKTDFLELELKFNPLKTLVQEQQVKISTDSNAISGLQTTQQELLGKIESITLQKNEIQGELEQEHLKNEEAHSIIQEQKALIEKQNAENNLLKRTMEEMAVFINSLQDEKLNFSLENISLESKFKTEKIEYKRRIKELEIANNSLVSMLAGSIKSRETSYATSDDDGY
ncbi:MAG: hypothetical protein H0T62_13385 [Parachlamydiaceae bacterium]|nr:hypothetical protein [Parachlamydiaceae bacterium]